MWRSQQMAAGVANTVIGNSSVTGLQCVIFWPLYVKLHHFFFDSPAKNFTHFPHLGFALTEYNAFQGPLKQQFDTVPWNVD